MKMFKKRQRDNPVNQIEEDNNNNQLSNMSEVLKRRREAKREKKNEEAIKHAEVSATQSEQRIEEKPITAAPVDYSNVRDEKAMCDSKSGVGSSKRPNPN